MRHGDLDLPQDRQDLDLRGARKEARAPKIQSSAAEEHANPEMSRQLPISAALDRGQDGEDASRYYSRMRVHMLMVMLQTLVPPAGSKLVLRAHAQGNQIYTCQQNAYTFSWGLKAPDAQLTDDSNRVIGRHFAGPTWQLNDGSQVLGRPVAKVDATEPNAVPWLPPSTISIQRIPRRSGLYVSAACIVGSVL
jgi:Protein of unknown function (DUF3455)